jgi:hypothetical protein
MQKNVGKVLRLFGSEYRDNIYPLNVFTVATAYIPADLNFHESAYLSTKFPPRHILEFNYYLSYRGLFVIFMYVTVDFVQWIVLLKTTRHACPRNKLGRRLRGTVCVVALGYGP